MASDSGVFKLTQRYRVAYIELHDKLFPINSDNLADDNDNIHNIPTPSQEDLIWSGFEAKLTIEAYSDFLSCSVDLDYRNSRDPSINPCMNLTINWDELKSLVKMVQVHSDCNTGYCRRGIVNGPCRFGYPKYLLSKTKLSIIKKDQKFYPFLQTRRNSRYINNYNPLQLALLKGNYDNQLILTNNELYNYITKYTCKPENTGSQLENILRALLANECTHNKTNAYIQILNLFKRVQSERNISSQEACLLLQKGKLFESSLFLVKINLYPPRQIQTRFVQDIAQASSRLQETTPNLAPTRQNIIQTLESDTTTSHLPLVTNASFDTSVDQGHHNEIGPFLILPY